MKKKIFLLIIISSVLNSCGMNLEQARFNFDNFNTTINMELAQAIRGDDADEVRQLLKNKKFPIDLKDPVYKQTLLALAIQNNKQNSFLELLKAGANPNELLGDAKDSTPFMYGIQNVKDCNMMYVEIMLKYKANPNLEIKNPNPGHVFYNSFPLFVAMGNRTHYCLDLIKLLVDNGADINYCYKQTYSTLCEGVISKSLTYNEMETLKYFVIEKNIVIPDTVLIMGELNKSTQQAFGLEEILRSKYYNYEDVKIDGRNYDKSNLRKIKNEILEYLEKKKGKK